MKVLFCSSECAPIVKIGGLGDVSRDLPKALSRLSVDIRVAIPLYSVIDRSKYNLEKLTEYNITFDGAKKPVTVWHTLLPESNVVVLLFENKQYLSGGGKDAFTGLEDELRRFAFFDRAVVRYLSQEEYWHPDVLHLNDWHLGLVPQFLKEVGNSLPHSSKEHPAILFTVHNLSYQGIADLSLFEETGLSIERSKVLSWDAKDKNIDFLLQGIAGADIINTVSPTYAEEVLTKKFGEGLNKVLEAREARLFGILNGVDTRSFNPETDKRIFRNYSVANWQEGKAENKKQLQEKVGLPVCEDTFLLSFIGRLEPKQKGLDLIESAWFRIRKKDIQFILLGVGNPDWEKRFKHLEKEDPNKFSAKIKFDTVLARQIFAGADALVMPSKFEPCGLPQMMAMRYGTVPIVHGVGGLKDTVSDGGSGFVFDEYSGRKFAEEVELARAVYVLSGKDQLPPTLSLKNLPRKGFGGWLKEENRLPNHSSWQRLVRTGMTTDFSWARSAKKYMDLYKKAVYYNSNH